MTNTKTSVAILFVQNNTISKQLYRGKVKHYGKFQREICRYAQANDTIAKESDYPTIKNKFK